MANMRLDKYLSSMGIGTRSEVKILIRKGQVEVNNSVSVKAEQKVDTDKDIIKFAGDVIHYCEYEYYMLNKPAGYVSATQDNVSETVISLVSSQKELFPVGRLDKDTEGLLLLTNDGELAHNLLSPKKHVEKTYYVEVEGLVTSEDVNLFEMGVDIGENKPTLPAKLKILKSDSKSEVELTICEGKFHQVKRMFEVVNKKVIYLKRISMGSLRLDESLVIGAYRKLTVEELEELRNRRG